MSRIFRFSHSIVRMLSESYVGLDSFVFSVLLNNYIHLWQEKAGNAVNVTSGASFLCQIVVLLFCIELDQARYGSKSFEKPC